MIKEHEVFLCKSVGATSSPKTDHSICLVHPSLSVPVMISWSLLHYLRVNCILNVTLEKSRVTKIHD